MFRLLDFSEPHCWRRRRVSIKGKDYVLIAGPWKQDTVHMDAEEAVDTQGFLVSDSTIYLIPPKEGGFVFGDAQFLVHPQGVWVDINE